MAGFAVTPSDILGADDEIDLVTLVDKQDALAAEARAALPYSFDECTFARGPLRQSVFSCLDCGERGVCYGCSISCHAEHRLVELWTRRGFTCDCPTESMAGSDASVRRCSLNPPGEQPYPANEGNRYGPNFSGRFCRCGRDYDPITEPEAMVTCIACEDWFHESCLNLQPQRTTFVNEDEDEEADCLIPSETYDGLVCAACVASHPLLVERRGTAGWMTIEPDGDGWRVAGRVEEEQEKDKGVKSDVESGPVPVSTESNDKREGVANPIIANGEPSGDAQVTDASGASQGTKRPQVDEIAPESKRARVEDAPEEDEAGAVTVTVTRVAAGDIFLGHGVRAALAETLDEAAAAALPFPLVDVEIYEPAEDAETETLEEVTERIVGSLPRVQAIEAVHGYQAMKDKLKVMLAAHAEAGSTVSREDIEGFFADLRDARA